MSLQHPMTHPQHPVWTVAIGVVVVAALGLLLKFNYQQFDGRDVTTMIATAAAYFVSTAVRGAAKNIKKSDETDEGSYLPPVFLRRMK